MNHKPLPDRSGNDLRAGDLANHLNPFTDYYALAQESGPRVITHGEGIYLWDTECSGLLGGMGGLWCINIGYGRKELGEVVHRQTDRLAFYNTFFKTSHEPVIELSGRLAELTPESIDNLFFSNSGPEVNDTAFRLVWTYWSALGKAERHSSQLTRC
ncbi:aminotransferase, partial [Microvirga vignae]